MAQGELFLAFSFPHDPHRSKQRLLGATVQLDMNRSILATDASSKFKSVCLNALIKTMALAQESFTIFAQLKLLNFTTCRFGVILNPEDVFRDWNTRRHQ
jgi:hypothetical protein